jgi:hypothetical protein
MFSFDICCNCIYWDRAKEQCSVNDMYYYDPDKFSELCPTPEHD